MSRYYRRPRRRDFSGAAQSSKPLIFWDQSRNSFIIKAPFSEKFKNDLLVVCQSAAYLGKQEQAWSIDENDLESAKIILKGIFGEFDFKPKPEASRQINLNGHSNAARAALTMFEIGGYEQAKRVYSLLIKEYHPDTNPDPNAHHKAAEITTAWRELKKEMGW